MTNPKSHPSVDPATAAFLREQTEAVTSTAPHIPFSREEYAGRLVKLQAAMAEDGIDTLVLSSPEAQNWLHGLALRWYKMQGPSEWRPLTCTVVRVDAGFMLFEGVEHGEMIRRTSVAEDVRLLPRYERAGMLQYIIRESSAAGWIAGSRVGLELFSPVPNAAVSAMISGAVLDAGGRVVDGTHTARRVRRVKSKAELAMVRTAAEICDAGLTHLGQVLRPGMTELEAHGELIKGLAAAGGEPAGIHQVVAVGSGALGTGHEISGRRVLQRGDIIEVDACGVYNRYHANRNMIFTVGEPADAAYRIQDLIAGAYPVLRASAVAGARVGDVNRALREYYDEAGVFDLNTDIWIGGYELGIAFPPDWVGEWKFTVMGGEDDDRVFEAGMVTNFESMLGFSLIDTLIYGEGPAETLSTLPHEFMVVSA
jgi:Xaa-Pro aminopeptidase